jgi:hypothetical protein
MGQRLDLNDELVSLLGSTNVYFQPPATLKMKYPCIVYNISDINSQYADNRTYANCRRYTVTIIDANPDSNIPEDMLDAFPYCTYDRHFTAENLHHSVLTLYY